MKTHFPLMRGSILPIAASAFLLCATAGVRSAAATDSPKLLRFSACVTDSSGHAVAGAAVAAYRHRYEQGRSPELELVTNLATGADGKFELLLEPYSPVVVSKPGLAPTWHEVDPQATNSFTMVLSPPTVLAGVVVDEARKPVSGAQVFVCVAHTGDKSDWRAFLSGKLAQQLFSSRTDASGRFRIETFPANSSAELDVKAAGKVLPPRRVQFSPKALLCQSGQNDIRLVVEPPAEIEGKVVTETGGPVSNARVELRASGHSFTVPWESTKAVTNGLFRFSGVAAGAYQAFAFFGTNQLPDWVAEPVPVTTRAGQTLRGIEVIASKGALLRVRSVDKPTGKPLEHVYLTVHTGSDYLHQYSDSNGLALFRLMPRRYDVHGMTDEGPLHAYVAAEVEAGQTNEATLEFSAPPLVSGIVRDPGGKPAPGLSVWSHPERPRRDTTTDANGRYELVHKEHPQVVVVVDAARNLAVSRELEDGVTNLDLQLAPALTVTGSVADPQGKPIPKAGLHVYLKSGDWGFPVYWQPVTTDTQGDFKLVQLPADRSYYINFDAKGYGSAQEKVPTEAGKEIELPPVVLKKADLRLAGQVVDSAGTPLANASLHVDGNGQPNMDEYTDSQGRFRFAVCPGKVYFTVWFQDLQTSVTAQGGDTNLVVTLKPRSERMASEAAKSERPKRASLVGKALPELAPVRLERDTVASGKPVLLCLFDYEQRPSRQALRLLSEQAESLRQKGVTVLGIQAAVVTSDSFNQWKQANPLPFKVGCITKKAAALTWATETDSLPWLILVNAQGRVAAEGFALEELSGKVGELGR